MLTDFKSQEKEIIKSVLDRYSFMDSNNIALIIENMIYEKVETYFDEEKQFLNSTYTTKFGENHGMYQVYSHNYDIKDRIVDHGITEEENWIYGKREGVGKYYLRIGLYHEEIDTSENEFKLYNYKIINFKNNRLNGMYLVLYYKPHISQIWIDKIKEFFKTNNIDLDEDKMLRINSYEEYKDGKRHGNFLGIDIAVDILTIYKYENGEEIDKENKICINSNGDVCYWS